MHLSIQYKISKKCIDTDHLSGYYPNAERVLVNKGSKCSVLLARLIAGVETRLG